MNDAKSRQQSFLVGTAACCIAAIILLLSGAMSFIMPASAKPPKASACASTTKIRYTAYDATPGSNRFGPTQSATTLAPALKRFNEKLCQDPAFTATLASFVLQGVNIDPTTVESNASALAGNSSMWQTTITGIKSQVKSYTVDHVNVTYETLAMVPGSSRSDVPSLIKVDRPVLLGYSLTLHMVDGSVRYLRIVCDMQPSAPHFPRVTTAPKPRPKPKPKCVTSCNPVTHNCVTNCNPVTHNCVTNCTPHKCTLKPKPGYAVDTVHCVYYKPPQSRKCMLNGGPNCPPNGGVQPGTQNVPDGTPGAGPRPVNNPGPAPAPGVTPSPNSSGYNSGSSTGSGTPQCNGSDCSSGSSGNASQSPAPVDNGTHSSPPPPPG